MIGSKYSIIIDEKYELDNDVYAPVQATFEIEKNRAGSMTLVFLPDNPVYNNIRLRETVADLYFGLGTWKWRGFCVSINTDFFNRKTVVFNGLLAALNETIQRPAYYQNRTVAQILSLYVNEHNSQVIRDDFKFFPTVDGFSEYTNLVRYTNHQTTMQEIQEDLVDNYGGYLSVRKVDTGTYHYSLDYTENPPSSNEREVKLGDNLLSLIKDYDSTDLCTAIIPLGATTGTQTIPNIDDRVTIESVNGGLDYLLGTSIAFYGQVWKVVVWDNISTPSILKTRAQEYLNENQWTNLVLEADVADLGTDLLNGSFWLYDQVHVVSYPHDVDQYFELTKLSLDFLHPSQSKFTLGSSKHVNLTEQVAKANKGGE